MDNMIMYLNAMGLELSIDCNMLSLPLFSWSPFYMVLSTFFSPAMCEIFIRIFHSPTKICVHLSPWRFFGMDLFWYFLSDWWHSPWIFLFGLEVRLREGGLSQLLVMFAFAKVLLKALFLMVNSCFEETRYYVATSQ